MIVYLDTSAFVKLVVEEADSERASRIWDAADIRLTSILTYVEARAAIAAARRDRRLSAAASKSVVVDLDGRWSECTRVGVSERLVRTAGDLAEREQLRGYDAVHLASAMRASSGDLVLATWDGALARAGRRVGLAVVPGVV